MFWNDIADIKNKLNKIEGLILCASNGSNGNCDHLGRDMGEVVKDSLIDILDSDDEYSFLNRIYAKLDELHEVLISQKTMDKFDDYMKNVEKLNAMINEFKGCVTMARGALEERKKVAEQEAKTAVLADMTQEIYNAMCAFIDASNRIEQKAHYKIDAMYKVLCEKDEKKSRKKRKYTKKKGVLPSLEELGL